MIDLELFKDGHAEDLQEILELYVAAFQRWKRKTRYRQEQRLADAFPVWWMLRGPTGFRTDNDRREFKVQLLAAIVAAEDAVAEPAEPAVSEPTEPPAAT